MATANLKFLSELEAVVRDRLANPDSSSYTASLAAAGTKRIAQKIGEEGVELALAALSNDRDELLDEAADLVYHLIVLLQHLDLGLGDVAERLESRHSV
ncbi:MAG: phosphoribosyl-ATP diphosphatase [Gammaproteobacteria bacterium]|nr:phosphoribosyl-ATP diphosphatase [Gammaproteobacteria bacterium]